ncbi:MAG: glycosyltransferase family 2 protein [Nanoarchaeota archaeon]|nr:glycosyltransferase family 2 protein [Nanoarchaeota archaeon]
MKVTAIVPVYNEEKTIGNVLKVLTSSNRIDKIVVVDDGGSDNTPKIIRKFKVKVITLKSNTGKGNAVKIATKDIKSDIILFLDADLYNLKKDHIDKMLKPVVDGDSVMVIGLMDKGNFIANMIMPYFPLTGGQRAILTPVFMEIRKTPLIKGWGLESVMNDYCRKKNLKFSTIKLDGVDHVGVQAKKHGLMAFLKQIYDVVLTRIKLLSIKYD